MKLSVLLRPVLIVVLVSLLVSPVAPVAAGVHETRHVAENAAERPLESAAGPGGSLLTEASERIRTMTEQFAEAGQGLLALPGLLAELASKAKDPETLAKWGTMVGKVLLVLLGALLMEWLVRRLLSRLRNSIVDRKPDGLLLKTLFLTFHTILDLVFIAVFASTAYWILPFTDPGYETRLIALTLVNAAVLARTMLAVFRLALAPNLPELRLLSFDQETIQYLYIWMRRLVDLSVFGYFILEALLLLGIPAGLHTFLMKFLGLTITTMLLILIMQNKDDVAVWIHGDQPGPTEEPEREDERPGTKGRLGRQWQPSLGAVRRRLADFWHIAATAVIIGLFLTWALEIEGGLAFLVSGLAMTAVVIALAGLLTRLVHNGLERLFRINEDLKALYPDLEARANRYKPFVSNALRIVILVITSFSVLEVWGLSTLGWLFSPMGGVIIGELIKLTLVIGGAFLLWEIASAMIERSLTREAEKVKLSSRKLTLFPLLRNVVRISLVVVASMLVLSQLGINVAPLLAGAGIIGLAVGFGAQTLVRDVITGAFILMEDALSVGDWVQAGGHSGTVERLTIRTVTLRDLHGTIHVVPFSEVSTVTNFNREYGYALIDAGVAYREKYEDVVQALQDVAAELKQDENWGPNITGDLEVFGMNNLGDSAVEIRVRLKTRPMTQFGVRRAFLERMKRVFDERGIEIPFPHRTIWFGTGKDGAAPPLYLAQEAPKALPEETACS